jgi:hypothetical protein
MTMEWMITKLAENAVKIAFSLLASYLANEAKKEALKVINNLRKEEDTDEDTDTTSGKYLDVYV